MRQDYISVSTQEIEMAVDSATRERRSRPDVVGFLAERERNVERIMRSLADGDYMELVRYRSMTVTNNNGKVRDILSPDLMTLVLQHLCHHKLNEIYRRFDNLNGVNCKPGCGITAGNRRKSVLRRAKHIFYDRRDLHYMLIADQRKCYDHIKVSVFRKALKGMEVRGWLNDFACEVCFHEGKLPIGAPTSPLVHHIVMLEYDRWVCSLGCVSIRYADDNFLVFATKEEANRAKWRIQNWWWYRLGMRAKRQTLQVVDIDRTAVDICGYILRRNAGRGISDHDKGYVGIRRTIFRKALRSNRRNWGSYFGILRHADTFSAMIEIESKMKLRQLTERIRIDRRLDADPVTVKELAENGTCFTIHDYEIRHDGKGRPNWIKCLVGIEEADDNGCVVTRAYEFHGGYTAIVDFMVACEKAYGRERMLPVEDCVVENRCGYVFKDSTNVIKYIDHD